MKDHKCIVCEGGFNIKVSKGKRPIKLRGFRPKGSITCSPKCGKTYRRIAEHIHNNKSKKGNHGAKKFKSWTGPKFPGKRITPIETETIPVDVEFKRKDGSSFKVKANKVIRKRVASKKDLRLYFHGDKK